MAENDSTPPDGHDPRFLGPVPLRVRLAIDWRNRNQRPRTARDIIRSFTPFAEVLCLYVIWNGAPPVKVGYSQDVRKRLAGLQTGRADTLSVYAQEAVETLDILSAEQAVHAMLKRYRLRGEWFDCHPEIALAAVRKVAWLAEDGPEPDF